MGQNTSPISSISSVEEVEAGDWKDIDEYTRELRDAGFDAEYENVWSGSTGFTAILYVNDRAHAVFERDVVGQYVKDVQNPLKECT